MLPIAASNLGNPMARVIPTSGAVEANQKGLAPDEAHERIDGMRRPVSRTEYREISIHNGLTEHGPNRRLA